MKGTQTFWSRRAALLSIAVALQAGGAAEVSGQSADSFDPNANSYVNVVVVQPDGKILIGGDFTMLSPNGGAPVTRNHIARVNPDGTLDAAFDPNASDIVYSIALQADGKILVGGSFLGANSIGGQTRNFIARLDPTTGLADSFDPNASYPHGAVYSIAVQADGKILAGGLFTNIGGQTRNGIARLDATTGLADSFNPSPGSFSVVGSIVVQPDGKILAGGYFTSIGGQPRNHIARLDAATGLADSFDPNANGNVLSIALQPDGKILTGGYFSGANSIGGQTRNGIARLDATTGLADSLDPNANAGVLSIAMQADGKILAGGGFTSIGGQARNRIARLDPTTGLADSFDPNASVYVFSIAVQADGKILVGGDFTSIGLQPRNNIARLEATAPTGSFVIGDVDAVIGHTVYFWGSQWSSHNHLSHGSAPSAFKGFANSIGNSAPTCGALWMSDPGNSSGPPSSVQNFITVIASSSITKSGPVITGNNRKIVVVRTDPGYGPNPAHPGTGTVVSVTCQ